MTSKAELVQSLDHPVGDRNAMLGIEAAPVTDAGPTALPSAA